MYSNAAILKAIGDSYFELDKSSRPEKSIPAIIANLGKATAVDRVYVFKNHLNELGEPCMTYTYEWCADGVEPQMDFEFLQGLSWGLFKEIETDLRTNRVINAFVKDTDNGDFYESMVAQGILSYLFIPIMVGSYFWGFIGFDNCSKEVLFTDGQVSSLHALAATLGTKIHNHHQRMKLNHSRKSYLELITNINDVVFRLDVNGTIVFINSVWEKLSGYAVEESVGKLAFDYYEQSYLPEIHKKLKSLVLGVREEDTFELKLKHKLGHSVWVKAYAKILKKSDGEVKGFTGTVVDIHKEKEMMLALQESEQTQQRLNELLQAVNEAHLSFFVEDEFQTPLEVFLDKILQITGSKFGFIGEVLFDQENKPFLRSHTLSNLAWDETSAQFFKNNYRSGIEFRNLDTLFGYTLKTGEVVISNDVKNDPRTGHTTPKGHPPLERYIGIPVKKAGKFIGMMGFANKPSNYTMDDIEYLQPLISGYANLISAIRINRAKKEAANQRKQLDAKYKLVSENTGDIIALHDLDMTFSYVSPSVERVLGVQPEFIIGKKPSEVFHVKEHVVDSTKELEKFVVPHTNLRTGEEIFLEILMTPLIDERGDIYKYLATSRDVTQREKMLKELKEMLAREKELNQLKTRFISMTSHEFRTPLATILSSTDILTLLLDTIEVDQQVAQKLTGHLNRINLQVERLTKVISDLLLIGKSNQDKVLITKQPVEIVSFLKNLVELFPVPDGRSLNSKITLAEKVVATDPVWLSHIIQNLIDNAFKYSRGSADPIVTLSATTKKVKISIQDFGIGIPAEEQKYIFETFFRAKNVSTIQGTGLGLNIVKDFADRLGVLLDFESIENQGTKFSLSIPLS